MNSYRSSKFVAGSQLILALAFFSVGMTGCSKTEQTVEKESTAVPTPVENVKAALQTVADSGELNSGTELIKEDLEKLKGTAGVDVDALQKDLQQLLQTKGPDQLRAKANQMIAKLPKS